MKRKIFMGIFLILILMANFSFASYSTVTMEVVEEPVCTIPLGENSKFEKKLVSKDLANKEVTLQLQVNNEEISTKPTGELLLVLDNSESMTHESSDGKIRKDLIYNSAKTLIANLLEDNTSLKIGIVQFSTNADPLKEGTREDSSIVSSLTNDLSVLNKAISNINANGGMTNLQAGLLLASEQFTETDNNKYMIVLTDGVPNIAVNNKNYFSDEIFNTTKQEIKNIATKGIQLITMLTGIDNGSAKPGISTEKTYNEIIEEVFGTQEEPTAGNFYYITDDEIEKTITEDIYNSLLPIEKSLKDITIVDYFPDYIVKNFDFAYVSESNIGTISPKIDTTNNSITWIIPELASGQTATVQYKLKLKENFDSSIVDKLLDTNEKVDVTYTDINGESQSKTSDVTPVLKLTEPPTILPKAGTITFITFGILAIGLLTFSIVKLSILYKKMN